MSYSLQFILTVSLVTSLLLAPVTSLAQNVAASDDNNSFDFDKFDKAANAGLAVIGAEVGALTGYLIGRQGSKRTLVYQSK